MTFDDFARAVDEALGQPLFEQVEDLAPEITTEPIDLIAKPLPKRMQRLAFAPVAYIGRSDFRELMAQRDARDRIHQVHIADPRQVPSWRIMGVPVVIVEVDRWLHIAHDPRA